MGLWRLYRHHLSNKANRRIIATLPDPRRERFLAGQAAAAEDRKQRVAGQRHAAFAETPEGLLSAARTKAFQSASFALATGEMPLYTERMELYNQLGKLTPEEYFDLVHPKQDQE